MLTSFPGYSLVTVRPFVSCARDTSAAVNIEQENRPMVLSPALENDHLKIMRKTTDSASQ